MASRLFRKAVQQGRRQIETGGVPFWGYVEDFGEPRTTLADFINSLLVRLLGTVKADKRTGPNNGRIYSGYKSR